MMTIYHTFRDLLFLSSETTLQSFFQFLQDGCKQKANHADLLGVLVNRGFDAALLALTNICNICIMHDNTGSFMTSFSKDFPP